MTSPSTQPVARPVTGGHEPDGADDDVERAQRERVLAELRAMRPAGDRQARLRQEFLATARAPGGLRRAGRARHLTASAAVLDGCGRHVLLCLHAKIGRWVQPGGHVEPADASLAAAALREATEETGLDGLVLWPDPVHLDGHPAPCAPAGEAVHDDVQYVLTVPERARPSVSAEAVAVRWFPADGLPRGCDSALRRLVGAARARIAAG